MSEAFESMTSLFQGKKPCSQLPPPLSYLHDDLWMDIFSRLPCETVFSSMCVCKSWHSLLSNPEFVVRFLNHERKARRTTTDHHKWGFILHPEDLTHKRPMHPTIHITSGSSGREFASHKLTLGFLPFYKEMKVVATFKDLVLCRTIASYNGNSNSSPTTSSSSSPSMWRVYHICNPLTKKWVTLPSSPLIYHPKPPLALTPYPEPWAALICEDVYRDDQTTSIERVFEYRFRVVVVERFTLTEVRATAPTPFKLTIFCSETGQWKKFRLFVPFPDSPYRRLRSSTFLQGVVCNRMVYLWHGYRFGAFDPFDEATTTTTSSSSSSSSSDSSKGKGSNAPKEEEEEEGGGGGEEIAVKIVLPLPRDLDWKLVECKGRLLLTYVSVIGARAKGHISIMELITTHEPTTTTITPTTRALRWETRAFLQSVTLNNSNRLSIQLVGVHPMNKDFFYLLATPHGNQRKETTTQLALCVNKFHPTKVVKVTLEPLSCSFSEGEGEGEGEDINGGRVLMVSSRPCRIELQCWPTPIPTIDQSSQTRVRVQRDV